MLKPILSLFPAAALAFFALGLASAPASAVAVDVTYDINAQIYSSSLGGTLGPATLYGPGSLTVRFLSGTTGGHVSAGPLHVVSGTLQLANTFSAVVLGNVINLTGFQNVAFGGSGVGSVTAGGSFNLATVGVIQSGNVHCSGILCSAAGFPASVVIPLTANPRPLSITSGLLANFPSLGPQTIALGNGNAGVGGGSTLTLVLTGQEVSRAVPEPGTGLLVGLGLAGLGVSGGAFGARRRR